MRHAFTRTSLALLLTAAAVSACGEQTDEKTGADGDLALTYEATSDSWCDDLGLEQVVRRLDDRVTDQAPEHTSEDGSTEDVCQVSSPSPDISPDLSGGPGSTTEPSTRQDTITVTVITTVRRTAPAPDLVDEKQTYPREDAIETNVATTAIEGWWDDGIAATASLQKDGEIYGYTTGAAVVHDNAQIEIGINVIRPNPKQDDASIDALRDELIDIVREHLAES